MINSRLVHPATDKMLQDFEAKPSHAVMLIGPKGSGKSQLASTMAEKILDIQPGAFNDHPYTTQLSSKDGKSIGIDSVRQLEHFLSLKVPLQTTFNRAVIIEDAHLLGQEAQNALLKNIEEPPQGTIMIMTVVTDSSILPTIRSRTQLINVRKPSQADFMEHFTSKGVDDAAARRGYSISGGMPGIMEVLLDDAEHPLTQAADMARQILSKTTFERLLLVDELSKDSKLAVNTLSMMQQMANVSLQSSGNNISDRWSKILSASYEAKKALLQSAQPKLVLIKLMLSI